MFVCISGCSGLCLSQGDVTDSYVKDSGKKFDTMANVSNLAGNPMSMVMDNTH